MGVKSFIKTFLDLLNQKRSNRTLLNPMQETLHFERIACWLNHLDAALKKYSYRVHYAICNVHQSTYQFAPKIR